MKIRKINVSIERFKQIFTNGIYHFQIGNGLNEGDTLFNIIYNYERRVVECYFLSETGVEVNEGCLYKDIESNSPIFTIFEK